MKFELKNVKHAEFASKETPCYQATLYIDGKRTAQVSNDGQGGCDMVHPVEPITENRQRLQAAEEHLAGLPPIVADFKNDDGSPFSYAQSLETECGRLLDEWLLKRDIKKALKRIVYVHTGTTKPVYQLVAKHKPTPANLARVAESRPEWTVLNTLPFNDLLKYWV